MSVKGNPAFIGETLALEILDGVASLMTNTLVALCGGGEEFGQT